MAQWVRARGMREGQAETVRKLLVQVEEFWGQSLKATPGGPRVIGGEVGALLVRAFEGSERDGRPVSDVMGELLKASGGASGEVSIGQGNGTTRGPSDVVPVDMSVLERRLRESLQGQMVGWLGEVKATLATQASDQVQGFLDQERALMAEERSAQRHVWNEQWEASRRKSMQGFEAGLQGVLDEFEGLSRKVSVRLERTIPELESFQQQVTELQMDIQSAALSVEEVKKEAREFGVLRRRVETLIAERETWLKQWQEAQGDSAAIRESAKTLLGEVKKARQDEIRTLWSGAVIGIMVMTGILLRFPSLLDAPSEQLVFLLKAVFLYGVFLTLRFLWRMWPG